MRKYFYIEWVSPELRWVRVVGRYNTKTAAEAASTLRNAAATYRIVEE
jgi:hypothetical protein